MENSEAIIQTNKYQTPVTKELLDSLPDEVSEQLLDCLTNIQFVKNLISPDRPHYKDLPRDENGRAIVDITNPPILEDADYFRQAAIHYQKHGCYTFLKPNSNPNSEYRKFWDEERRRCLEGFVRKSDGAWVSGLEYWFLNYNPMMVNIIEEGSQRADRIESFPFFFEGINWRFNYINRARSLGKHAIELAKRGAHPYFQKVYTPDGIKTWEEIKVGDKLFGTYGNITTVTDIPFDDLADTYKITLRDGREVYASDEHLWVIGTSAFRRVGIKTTIEMFNDPNFRLKSGLFKYAIPGNNGVDYNYQELPIEPYTFGVLLGDATFRHTSLELAQSKDDLESIKHHIPYRVDSIGNSGIHYTIKIPNWKIILKEMKLLDTKSDNKFIPDIYKYNTKEVRLNVLKGLMDTDGRCSKNRSPQFCTVSEKLKNDVIWIAHSLGYRTYCTIKKSGYKKDGNYIQCKDSYVVTICGSGELFNLERKSNIANNNIKVFKDFISIKSIEYVGKMRCKCVSVDALDGCYLIGDFVTTHNCAKSYTLSAIMTHNLILGETEKNHKRVMTVLCAYQKEYLKDDKDGTLSKFRPSFNFIASNTPFPRLLLKNSPNEMSWQMGYKDEYGRDKGSLNTVMAVPIKEDRAKLRGKRGFFLFEEMGSMPGLLEVYDVCRRSVEDGGYAFGQMYLVGTAAEDESDFSSAKTLLYSPEGYNIHSVHNVYDRPKQGKPTFGYFFPAYINRAGCYNKNGVSDVVKALIEILLQRHKAKYSTDPKSVLRVIAEDPITPAEAIIKVKSAFFPTVQLTERLAQLDTDPKAFDDVYIGNLVLNKSGEVEFKVSNDTPIRKYGVENDTPGALEIFEMPEKQSNGKPFNTRYIVGHDPVDNDQADSSSLSSTFVLDLFTDRIVAEYTGRQPFADDNFEVVRLLCLFYNAKCLYESNKKGLYAYFSKLNCTHLLADTPEYLRDKQLVKYSSFGSNQKGVNASAAINNYANGLIRDWLLQPVSTTITENNETKEIQMPRLYLLRNRALIEELIAFTPEINVDRIRALGMVMLYREEKIILYQGNLNAAEQEKISTDYLGNDDYFSRNYNQGYMQ